MKSGIPALPSVHLLDQVRERVRSLHYSLSTKKSYVHWVRFFIRWQGRGGVMRHPREMGAPEVEAFLTMLATERHVSASTHNQALSALLFLYREVLGVNLPWLDYISRPAQKRRIPSVLTQDEVAALFQFLDGEMALLAKLLYGTGMRSMEGLRLRVKAAGGTASPLDRLLKVPCAAQLAGNGGHLAVHTAISSRTPSASMSAPLPAFTTSPRDITQ